jgi:hypothetical protein
MEGLALADYVGCVAASTSLGMTAYHGPMTFTKNIGMPLLAIYLILVGLIGVFGFHFGFITGIIAFIAGIFILLGR